MKGESHVALQQMNSLIGKLLPAYAEARKRWPLWTYERRGAELQLANLAQSRLLSNKTWYGCQSWAERLAWSPLHRIRTVFANLESWLGGQRLSLLEWLPDEPMLSATLLPPDTDEEEAQRIEVIQEYGDVDYEIPVPPLLRVEMLALSAQFALVIPPSAEFIEPLIGDFGGLDQEDFRQLTRHLTRVLLRVRPVPRSPGVVASRNRKPPLLYRILQHEMEPDSPGNDRRESLGTELLSAAGLIPDRTGGARSKIGVLRVLQLYEEAVDIVEAVRKWEPDQDLIDCLCEIPTVEPNLVADFEIERSRVRRGLYEKALGRLLWRLRFPFLLESEVSDIRTVDDHSSEQQGAQSLARQLVMGRLPRFQPDRDDPSFSVMLSKARSGRNELGQPLVLDP